MSKSETTKKQRLDRLMVDRELCESRTKAQGLILAGQVIVNDHAISKPGTLVFENANIRIKGELHPYVSRGGVKLAGALDQFAELEIEGRVAMDVGASTGGFTDCLLQRGAKKVFAVDVGYGQLAWKLVQDERVVVLDRQNIRSLKVEQIGEQVSLMVADCSFISLTKILPVLPAFLSPTADLVALVKPQFEAGREQIGKGGIVRDAKVRAEALANVVTAARAVGFELEDQCESPIAGREGNQEYLIWLRWLGQPTPDSKKA